MVRMGAVWDRATEFVGDNLRTILPFALVIMVVAVVSDLAVQATQGGAQAAQLATRAVVLVIAIVSVFARLAITALAIDDRRSGGDAAALALGRLLSLIAVLVVLVVVGMLLVVPMGLAIIVGGVDVRQLATMQADAMAALPTSVRLFEAGYLLLLLVVGLWLSARLALVTPVVIAERRTLGAITRSFVLTRGLALRILGVLVLIGVVGAVAVMAAKTVFGSVLRLMLGDGGAMSAATILTAIVVALVATVFSVIGDAFIGKLYLAAYAAEREAEPAA